jgi:hypothetical protein
MFLLTKYYIPKWLIIAAITIILLIIGLVYYFFNTQNSNQNGNSNLTNNNVSNTNQIQNTVEPDYTDLVSKVQPASKVSFSQYKTLSFADGTELITIPKELVTREPFKTAFNKSVESPDVTIRDKLLFIYNPSLDSIIFTGTNLVNLETVLVNGKEYWVFSIANIDGTEKIYYSLPNFARQRLVKELPFLPITQFNKINNSNVQVIFNQSQRGENLVKYNIDFAQMQFTTDTTNAEFTDKPPAVTVVK